jgi:hypothetical protein
VPFLSTLDPRHCRPQATQPFKTPMAALRKLKGLRHRRLT